MRWIKFIVSLLGTVGLIVALQTPFSPITFQLGQFFNPFKGFWQNAVAVEEKNETQNIRLQGLSKPVEVVIDDRHVPHIFARNNTDAVYTQGYLTARDRLWQMEFQTYAAAGRLSEILGKGPNDAILRMDRTNRRKGMVWGAERSFNTVMANPETKVLMEAYAKGVNDYIKSLNPKDYPIEYKLLNYKPEAWTPFKTALLLKYMANSLSGGASDMSNTHAISLWGKDIFELLYPERPYAESPIIPEKKLNRYQLRRRNGWGYQADPQPEKPADYFPDSILSQTAIPAQDPDIGSNNWAVAGSKSSTGKPLLAGDPHLGLNLPSIWYEIQIKTPEVNVYGVSLPGAPGVTIGFNDSIAWSMTNAGRDVLDFYAITFKSEARSAYLYEDRWEATRVQYDTIKIKGEDPFIDTVLYTHIGPVMYDRNFGDYPKPLAARWMAHEESNEMLAFLLLNQAKNYKDYTEAISHYVSPAQNFVFASVAGDIAIWQQGKFVNRWPEQGKFILDGSDSTHMWNQFIPQTHNPHILNPPRGYVSSANQQATDITYPYYYYGRFEGHRNRRINQLLAETDSISVYDMKRFQLDNYGLMAEDILPLLLSELDSADLSPLEQTLKQTLERWDYNYDPDMISPTIYQRWWDQLFQNIWRDDIRSQDVALRYPSLTTTIGIIRDSVNFRFYDKQETPQVENRTDLIFQSFQETIQELSEKMGPDYQNWQWATYKGTQITHLTRIAPFSKRNLPIGGNRGILNATTKGHGPSWRMVVSLGTPIEAHGVYPGGQSGNVGSPHYDEFVQDWAQGNYYPLWFMRGINDQAGAVAYKLSLIPGS